MQMLCKILHRTWNFTTNYQLNLKVNFIGVSEKSQTLLSEKNIGKIYEYKS